MKEILSECPLLIAFEYVFFCTIKLLLENGADVNLRNLNSVDPLFKAIDNKHHSISELLMHSGIEID